MQQSAINRRNWELSEYSISISELVSKVGITLDVEVDPVCG